jgi:hypothetical protein
MLRYYPAFAWMNSGKSKINLNQDPVVGPRFEPGTSRIMNVC